MKDTPHFSVPHDYYDEASLGTDAENQQASKLTDQEIERIAQNINRQINTPILLTSECMVSEYCDQRKIEALRSRMSKILMDYMDSGTNGDLLGYLRYDLTMDKVYGDGVRFAFGCALPVDVYKTVENIKEACRIKKWAMIGIPCGEIETVSVHDVSPRGDYDEYGNVNDKNCHVGNVALFITTRDMNCDSFNLFVNIGPSYALFNVSNEREYKEAKTLLSLHKQDGTQYPFNGCLEFVDLSKAKRTTVEYAVYADGYGFTSRSLFVNDVDCDVESNYNDDFDINKLYQFVNSETSGLAIIHGKPGTGKTTILRKMITDNRYKRNFILMDKNMFNNMTDRDFMMYLIDHSGSVLIFEDCEAMLVKREEGNSKIDTILNISDGILGDMLNLKIICTFNAEMIDIDEALLRKGRLKYIYEMKPLEHDKAVALAKKVGIDPETLPDGPVSLADIYNANIDNNNNKPKEKTTVGFGL